MSAYCTQADLQDVLADLRLAELTAESGSVVDASVLATTITAASGIIDRYFGGRYAIPVSDAGTLALLVPVCVSLVKFRLYDRRDLSARDNPCQTEYDEVIRWLERVADGTYSLPPTATEATSPDSGSADAAYGSDDPAFAGEALL